MLLSKVPIAEAEKSSAMALTTVKVIFQIKSSIKKGKIIEGISGFYKVMFKSKYYRPNILNSAKIALITKLNK